MKIWLVLESDAKGSCVRSAHRTHAGAMKGWHTERKKLLRKIKRLLKIAVYEGWRSSEAQYRLEAKNLANINLATMDNYPHARPALQVVTLED